MSKKNLVLVISLLIINTIYILIVQPACPWKNVLNIDCAGCGSTRMVKAILRLDFYQAFRYNPFIFCTLILFVFYLIYVLVCLILKREYFKVGMKSLICFIILLVIFMILRNTQIFGFLKPVVVR